MWIKGYVIPENGDIQDVKTSKEVFIQHLALKLDFEGWRFHHVTIEGKDPDGEGQHEQK